MRILIRNRTEAVRTISLPNSEGKIYGQVFKPGETVDLGSEISPWILDTAAGLELRELERAGKVAITIDPEDDDITAPIIDEGDGGGGGGGSGNVLVFNTSADDGIPGVYNTWSDLVTAAQASAVPVEIIFSEEEFDMEDGEWDLSNVISFKGRYYTTISLDDCFINISRSTKFENLDIDGSARAGRGFYMSGGNGGFEAKNCSFSGDREEEEGTGVFFIEDQYLGIVLRHCNFNNNGGPVVLMSDNSIVELYAYEGTDLEDEWVVDVDEDSTAYVYLGDKTVEDEFAHYFDVGAYGRENYGRTGIITTATFRPGDDSSFETDEYERLDQALYVLRDSPSPTVKIDLTESNWVTSEFGELYLPKDVRLVGDKANYLENNGSSYLYLECCVSFIAQESDGMVISFENLHLAPLCYPSGFYFPSGYTRGIGLTNATLHSVCGGSMALMNFEDSSIRIDARGQSAIQNDSGNPVIELSGSDGSELTIHAYDSFRLYQNSIAGTEFDTLTIYKYGPDVDIDLGQEDFLGTIDIIDLSSDIGEIGSHWNSAGDQVIDGVESWYGSTYGFEDLHITTDGILNVNPGTGPLILICNGTCRIDGTINASEHWEAGFIHLGEEEGSTFPIGTLQDEDGTNYGPATLLAGWRQSAGGGGGGASGIDSGGTGSNAESIPDYLSVGLRLESPGMAGGLAGLNRDAQVGDDGSGGGSTDPVQRVYGYRVALNDDRSRLFWGGTPGRNGTAGGTGAASFENDGTTPVPGGSGGAGGNGGDGGGSVTIYARTFILGDGGLITVAGGNGSNGESGGAGSAGAADALGNGGGGGGGGGGTGGNGGTITILSPNWSIYGQINTDGGWGGDGGTGGAGGSNGIAFDGGAGGLGSGGSYGYEGWFVSGGFIVGNWPD